MAIGHELVDREQHVEGADDVVVLGVDGVATVDHGVWSRPLLGEVNYGLGLVASYDLGEELPIQQIAVLQAYGLSTNLLPDLYPVFRVGYRREARRPELVVYGPPHEVVHDDDLVTDVREVHRGRPT